MLKQERVPELRLVLIVNPFRATGDGQTLQQQHLFLSSIAYHVHRHVFYHMESMHRYERQLLRGVMLMAHPVTANLVTARASYTRSGVVAFTVLRDTGAPENPSSDGAHERRGC